MGRRADSVTKAWRDWYASVSINDGRVFCDECRCYHLFVEPHEDEDDIDVPWLPAKAVPA